MNLLLDKWIPVQKNGIEENISLKRLLCQDENWQLCLPRDDMELVALRLIVCVVQVIFMPENAKQLRKNHFEFMPEKDYEKKAFGCGLLSISKV